jgi:hypothetical protein
LLREKISSTVISALPETKMTPPPSLLLRTTGTVAIRCFAICSFIRSPSEAAFRMRSGIEDIVFSPAWATTSPCRFTSSTSPPEVSAAGSSAFFASFEFSTALAAAAACARA